MYDLIIIGGGPSGSAAGRIAGKNNLKTLLIEKEKFPRYKPCAGAFSEHAMSYLDFLIPSSLQERDIFGARIHYKGQKIERFKKFRIAVLVTRNKLDHYLIKKTEETGIEIHFNEKAFKFKEEKNRVKVYSNNAIYQCKYLIIAEGSHGYLKQQIRKKDKKTQFGICAVTEIPENNEIIDDFLYNSIDIYFGLIKMGYGWIFPHENYYSIGIGGFAKYITNPKKIFNKFLLERGFSKDYYPKIHLIPAGGIKRKIRTERVLLIGDAAGFVDSFYGEGIAYAIRSGQIAADIVASLIRKEKKINSTKIFESLCEKEFGKDLMYSLYLTKLMHYFPKIFFKILLENEYILDKYLDVPSKKLTYKKYLIWLLSKLPYLYFKTL